MIGLNWRLEMGFKPLKFIGKLISKIVPGGGIIADIIAPGKTQNEKNQGLEMLTPIAQYNRTMARPRIAIAIVFTYLGGVIIQWIQVLCGVQKAYQIVIPLQLSEFAVIVVTVIVGSRGIEKIVDKIFKKKK